MISLTGRLRKMATQHTTPISYELKLADGVGGLQSLALNPCLGKTVSLEFSGNIYCVHCERKTNKSFSQGYCYPCFKMLAQCDTCMIKPEACHYHLGTCREPRWGEAHCFKPHLIYLASTTGLKVGITRETNNPTRWMDQGAIAALPLLKVTNRLASGLIETTLRQTIKDKTAWQRMLKNDVEDLDLVQEAQQVLADYQPQLKEISNLEFEILALQPVIFEYPVLEYPIKVKSLNLDKIPTVTGQLLGIKGQYLLLDTGVINLRKYAGYEVRFSAH
ncbi:MAG TPA: DUF2797 domain-containing protein [Marinospirillum sp.]|uniref:DUF2797 domain-containing protein n=1 Tax=Marinospirillum sp. TaxID=2183934 RepID=UPI002B486E49|nr:DUF2797 domain-containing protein [Marinospirillum sp.]HKM14943.1 DUF2797 domain-containing protein [Marinospirillum sp.]